MPSNPEEPIRNHHKPIASGQCGGQAALLPNPTGRNECAEEVNIWSNFLSAHLSKQFERSFPLCTSDEGLGCTPNTSEWTSYHGILRYPETLPLSKAPSALHYMRLCLRSTLSFATVRHLGFSILSLAALHASLAIHINSTVYSDTSTGRYW